MEGAIFLSNKAVVVGQGHNKPLNLKPDTLDRVKNIADTYGAWYEGNGSDTALTKNQIKKYKGSWDDIFAKSIPGYPSEFLYVLFANVQENNRLAQIGTNSKSSIFDRLMYSQSKFSFFPGRKFSSMILVEFLKNMSESNVNFLELSKLPATKKNLSMFLSRGEDLMWPSNWESYPYKAGKIARKATIRRDEYLASVKEGAYITGSGHLLEVKKLSNKPIEK